MEDQPQAVAIPSVHYPAKWKVCVEGIGKVSRATIKMAPLVVLVGKNNTGKSQVAALIWSLMNANDYILEDAHTGALFGEVPDWFRDALFAGNRVGGPVAIKFDREIIEDIQNKINLALNLKKDRLAKQLFSYEGAVIGALKLDFSDGFLFNEVVSVPYDEPDSAILNWTEVFPDNGEFKLEIGAHEEMLDERFLKLLFGVFVSNVLVGARSGDDQAMYIPAARTGLMLSYSVLVSSLFKSLRGSGGQHEALGRFTAPTVQFLERLALTSGPHEGDRFSQIATSLEKRLLGGTITIDEGVGTSFKYQPSGSEVALPLHVSSSMVTELAPFLLLLKAGMVRPGLVFEEPESHLHISAQREISKSIVKLVNMGVPVVVTTHSDTFIQQLNLAMQIYQNKDSELLKSKYGYSSEEVINPSYVRAYEFISGNDGTTVNELEKTEYGFVVPSLNEHLESFLNEVVEVGG